MNTKRNIIKKSIIDGAEKLNIENPRYRKGQSVFNFVELMYPGLARQVQFNDHVDCFYIDKNIDNFIEKCLDRLLSENSQNKQYQKPEIETIEVNVENGFASSSDRIHKQNGMCWCGEIHHENQPDHIDYNSTNENQSFSRW